MINMAYNFTVAKDVLTDKDKDRLVCLFLNRTEDKLDNTVSRPYSSVFPIFTNYFPQIDYEKATAEFGAKSVDSMKVMTRSVLKKIADAGGKSNGNGDSPAPKRGGGRKRKAAQDDDDEASPALKKKGRGKRKVREASPDGEYSTA